MRYGHARSWRHLPGHFVLRLLTLLGMYAVLGAAETIPLLDVTYQRSADCSLPDPLSIWWQSSIAEAGAWCRRTMKGTADPQVFLSHLQTCHVLAGGMQDGATLRPTVACAWSGDALPPAMASVIRAWPGHALAADDADAGHGLFGPGFKAPPSREHLPAGWHVTLDGRGVAQDLMTSSWRAQFGLPDAVVAQLGSIIAAWQCRAAVAPGGRGWVDSGLPQAWFKPIALSDIQGIPATSVAAFAVGIDGPHLAHAVVGAIKWDGPTEALLSLPAGLSPEQAAMACDGTWILCTLDDGSWMLSMPRSAAMDELLQDLARDHQFELPSEGGCIQVLGCYCACHPHAWLWSNALADIPLWAPSHVAAVAVKAGHDPGCLWAFAQASDAAQYVDRVLGPALAIQCAMPESLAAARVSSEFAATMPDPCSRSWPGFLADLGRLPDIEVHAHAGGPTLRIDLDGGMAPWLAPGLAMRYCADYVQEQVGITRLLHIIVRLRAEGESTDISDSRCQVRSDLVQQRFRAERMLQALTENRSINRMASWRRYLTFGPVAMGDDESLQEARTASTLLPLSDAIDDPAFPSGVEIEQMRSDPQGDDGSLYSQTAAAAQYLCNAGFTLIANGDRRGLVLLNRAVHFVRRPRSDLDAALAWNIAINHDVGYLIAETRQLLDPVALAAFLHEEDRFSLSYWTGERVLACGKLARFLTGTSQSPVAFCAPELGQWQLLRRHDQWASAADDLASCMLAMQTCESDSYDVPAELAGVSSQLGVDLALTIMKSELSLQFAVAQCQLLHLAARIEALALAGTLPKSQAALEGVIGPIQVSWGSSRRQLSYEMIGAQGFHLFLESTQGAPPGWSARAWSFMTVKPPANANPVYIRHRGFSVSIDPAAARQPMEGIDTVPGSRP